MMVETMLESAQDFGMSGGALPQWKRELLQRRAARSRPLPAPAPAPPPPPAAPDEDEELRYGPGIVKRLKSRYLSLALRDAPRRRPSVLRRAASLEHLLEQRPPPAPRPAARAPRPASLAAPPPPHAPQRRDLVKRARSVDALSRLEPRDDPPPSPPPAPPVPPAPPAPPAPRPSARPPRRPAPLLRDGERPPPDLVKSTLRKFEPAAARRSAPAARVAAALRGLERSPAPDARSPSPARSISLSDSRASDEFEGAATSTPRPVSRAALEGIARAGSSTRYAFESPRRASHLPPLAATNGVLVGRARRVGVIRPMPAPPLERALSAPLPPAEEPAEEARAPEEGSPRAELPSALVEPIPRPPPAEAPPPPPRSPPPAAAPEPRPEPGPKPKMVNGHAAAREAPPAAEAWSGAALKKADARGEAARRGGRGAPAATSVVFNFSHRKEVPDYIENDGLVLRAARRDRYKAGEAGVVVLEAGALEGAEAEAEEADGPPSPCAVRFVNAGVLINGRSSMPPRAARDLSRTAKLKLQFDDSLTRTFEYPSETSLCEEDERAPSPAAPAAPATLAANTHISSAALGRYTPSKTCADAFQLGVTRRAPDALPAVAVAVSCANGEGEGGREDEAGEEGEGEARCWADPRRLAADLLF